MTSAHEAGAWRLPVALAAVGLLLLVLFDLGPAVAINDDWVYAWSVTQLAAGRGIQNLPDYGVLHLPQTLVAFALSLGHDDRRVLRLTAVPFVLVTSLTIGAISRHVGAHRFWSGVAAAVPLTMPIPLSVATGFMTEYFYMGLLLPAAYFGTRWVERGRGIAACVALATLATLERPHGLIFAPALTVALLVQRRRPRTRADWMGLAALWVGAVTAVVGPVLVAPGTYLSHQDLTSAGLVFLLVVPTLGLPFMLCSLGLPFMTAVARATARAWRRHSPPGRVGLLATVAWALLAVGGLPEIVNVWRPSGLGPQTVAGVKPALLVTVLGLGLLAVLAPSFPLMVLLQRRAGPGTRSAGPPRTPSERLRDAPAWLIILGLVAAGHLASLTLSGVFDRYYLPVVLPLLPIAALLATRAEPGRRERAWALACMFAGLVVYGVGEQDYLAWQAARDSAVHLVPAAVSPLRVNAGYEGNAVHALLPYFDANGRYPAEDMPGAGRGGLIRFLLDGPRDAAYTLCFAGPGTAGVGVSYSSAASGRVLVVPGSRCPVR